VLGQVQAPFLVLAASDLRTRRNAWIVADASLAPPADPAHPLWRVCGERVEDRFGFWRARAVDAVSAEAAAPAR
jgi:hypothetical protein